MTRKELPLSPIPRTENGKLDGFGVQWIAHDHRSFGEILSDWIDHTGHGNAELFCKQLGIDGEIAMEDIIGLIAGNCAPSGKLNNLLSGLIPDEVCSWQVLRNRGYKAAEAALPQVTLSPVTRSQALLNRLNQIVTEETSQPAQNDAANAFTDWLTNSIEEQAEQMGREVNVSKSLQNLAAYLGVSPGQLFGKDPLQHGRAIHVAEELAGVLGLTDDAYDQAVELATSAWFGGAPEGVDHSFTRALRMLRRSHGWTQKELAQRLGLTGREMSLLERGLPPPDNRTLSKLSNVLELTSDLSHLISQAADRTVSACLPRARRQLRSISNHFMVDGLTIEDMAEVACTHPQLLYQQRATLIANIEGVVNHFAEDGLTRRLYLAAALNHPSLFTVRPHTVIGNIEGVVNRFAEDGLTKQPYLAAALRQPQLFSQKPATLIGNIEGVVNHFAADGLTKQSYLAAALKQPSLIALRSYTVIGNIEGVVNYFAADGLTKQSYLATALKQPQLWYQKSTTLIGNIEGVVNHFAADGLTKQSYLAAALKQPSLFSQKPETVIGHLNLIIAMYRREQRTLAGHQAISSDCIRPPPLPSDLSPVFDYVLKNPMLLSYSDQNLALRDISAVVSGIGKFTSALTYSKKLVADRLRSHLGHPDPTLPVPKLDYPPHASCYDTAVPSNEQREANILYAKNLLHRALIREGLLYGSLAPNNSRPR